MLGRDTNWRQGCILNTKDAIAIGLLDQNESKKYVVVISHDCDLPNEKEEIIEVIVGTKISKVNSLFTNARNPRLLHLNFSLLNSGDNICIELSHSHRHTLDKNKFTKLAPNNELKLETNEKQTLKQWLAARYGRPAFPNTFENRLRKKYKKRTVEQHISDILKPVSEHLIGVFLDLGDELACELEPDESYFLKIFLVYDAIEGGTSARKIAEETATKINVLFFNVYQSKNPSENQEIVLEKCDAIADTHMTLADLRKVSQWRVEYISLRNNPPDPFIAAGE
ncbi:hypothetical protein SAMN05421690_102832 [Nitrosomonas sp. Nm51]|uniref:hypothetical protein n=1 Tax=Nitrosomonas sp. Nm51 TaxID=133720 RepID=UPI0008BCEA07|nr:hypothetical protein [Nitrosomonas sp. Nm51]SER46251.1 hypothetical protein SAMN05421690_102832 [Nitrosomonas sp. Nm51]